MKKKLLETAVSAGKCFTSLTNISAVAIDVTERRIVPCGSSPCDSCACLCDRLNTHLYGLNEASRWGGRYIYYCPLGLVFCAAPLTDDGDCVGGMVLGPAVMGDGDDTLFFIHDRELHEKFIRSLPSLSTSAESSLSELLRHTAFSVSGGEQPFASPFASTDDLLKTLYQPEENTRLYGYPIQYESQIHDLIADRDRDGAMALINELLGHIFLSGVFDFSGMKTRITELIVVLSRSSADAGGNIGELFLFNDNYIKEIESCDTFENLSRLSAAVIHKYTDYIFDFSDVQQSDAVYKAIRFMREKIGEKISVNDICEHVFLSRSSFCRVFREQTGKSISEYLNYLRTEQAKRLLADKTIPLVDIAMLCGFEDQSYFSKVFRKYTSVSPKRYRDGTGSRLFLRDGRREN